MPVQNRIIKIQKRNRALVNFDSDKIRDAIRHAAESIGGLRQDYLPGINSRLFEAYGDAEDLAAFLADMVVVCLNSEPHHLIANFPPTIETIQDSVLHVLRSHGFQITADAYECYRWGRHWMREGAIPEVQFVGNGFPRKRMGKILEWNQQHGCDTVAALSEQVRRGQIKALVDESLAGFEAALDEAARKLLVRLQAGDRIRLLWVVGPSCSGKTTTTVKLTERLEREGLRFLMLNLDDYFWGLVEHPTDWINDRNFETPEALDIQLLNEQLKALLDGKTIDKPIYSFKEGRRAGAKPVRLEPDQILLLDCLHGFYPPITDGIDPGMQFRVYIETLNVLYEGDGQSEKLTRFTDVRLIRRMIRDDRHRNHSPLSTLLHWHYVRAGELFSIIPLMGLADHILNAGLPFDLPVLKPFFAGPQGILPPPAELAAYPGFLDARIRYERIRHLLESVEGLTPDQVHDEAIIPGDALIREFVGGSTIHIPHNE